MQMTEYCRVCNTELTPVTWDEYLEKIKQRLCKECRRQKDRVYYQNNTEKLREIKKKSLLKHPRKYDKEKSRIYHVRYMNKVKQEVFNHYGGKCVCCGEDRIEFLTLGHPNNDGNKHRMEVLGARHGSTEMYVHLRARNYETKYVLDIECYNCNCALAHYGYCPHKKGGFSPLWG